MSNGELPTFTIALITKLSPKQHTCLTYIKITNCWNLPTPAMMMTRFFPMFTQVNFQSLLLCLISKTLYHKNKIFISKRRIFFLQSVDRLRKQLNSLAKLASGTKPWLIRPGSNKTYLNISKRKIASLLEEREQILSPGQGRHQKTIRILLKRLKRQHEGNPFSQMRQSEHQ